MTPEEFVRKWSAILRPSPPAGPMERALSQQHFLDLCDLLAHKKPADADPSATWFCFEKPLTKISGTKGYADVWKRDFFAIEYKGPHKDLTSAYAQLKTYTDALENPPLLVVSDMERIIIHTNFTATVKAELHIGLDDLADPEKLGWLRALFHDPEKLRPGKTRIDVTREAADQFGQLSLAVGDRYADKHRVAHFLNRLIFCLFAEDIGLLPEQCFTKMLDVCVADPAQFPELCEQLFAAMAKGGRVGWTKIEWFNGGLFDNTDTLELTGGELRTLRAAASLDWSDIEPAIFGTLFERGLDPSKRAQLGAHYTDPETIERLIDPVIRQPLQEEWQACRVKIAALLEKADAADAREKAKSGKKAGAATTARKEAEQLYLAFLKRLKDLRVLDPACGSGNFLYLALKALKDMERWVRTDAALLRLPVGLLFETGPENICGIELNPYAAELARVSVWIGELQWMIQNGYGVRRDPILRTLDQIECRDAVLNADGSPASWPPAEAIVGNPPFLGDRKMIRELGEGYVTKLRAAYDGRVPGGADLVCYWFEKGREQIATGETQRVGLVATNSIRSGLNRRVLERIVDDVPIFEAWSDEGWINDGAAVRVSLVAFGKDEQTPHLDGAAVESIHADLTAGDAGDLTQARVLPENRNISFVGTQKNGPFAIPGDIARSWLKLPNPHGKSNDYVVRPWANGQDITKRPSDTWVIDFNKMPEADAALYEAPFSHVVMHVKPTRIHLRRDWHRTHWWLFGDPRPGLRTALGGLQRMIVTPLVSKWRVFVWMPAHQIPENLCVAIARDDDASFGVLQSRIHEVWTLAKCSWLGVGNDPRYTPSSTFETFPFPEGMTPNLQASAYTNSHADAVAEAAGRLNELRENWLNPLEWVDHVPEVVAGYPDRMVAKSGHEDDLKKRTLTNLYNGRPTWLANVHDALDRAVAEAYGWEWPLSDEEITSRLLALNLARTA